MTTVEPAKPEDQPAIVGLLESAGLPLDGLERTSASAIVARDEAGVIGCAAIEPYGQDGLLRSVAVELGWRERGVGHRLVEAAEAMAASSGIRELYLLTETAADWFGRLGYRPTDRADVPQSLLASPEFTTACPVSAVAMRKRLEPAAR